MSDENKNEDQQDDEGKTTEFDTTSEAFQTAVATAVAEATGGLKQNRDAVLQEKRELKEKHDALANELAGLGDLETVKQMVDRFKNDEEAKLIAEGKIDEVLNKRTESLRKDAETRVASATERVTQLEQELGGAKTTIAALVIDSNIDQAAAKLECTPTALADIRRAAREVFAINDENNVEARDSDGVLLMGKDGKTALTPATWLEQSKATNPHWWGAAAGGGAAGGTRVGGKDVDAKVLESMTGKQKIAAAMGG
jgi:hypothetical protein